MCNGSELDVYANPDPCDGQSGGELPCKRAFVICDALKGLPSCDEAMIDPHATVPNSVLAHKLETQY